MTEILWIIGGGVAFGTVFTMTYLAGSRYGFKQGEQINRSIEHNIKITKRHYEELEAMACVSSGKCRRTPNEYTNELLIRIAMKELWRQVEDGEQEMPPEYIEKMMNNKGDLLSNSYPVGREPCDCGEGCDTCQTAKDTQAITDANKEAAGTLKNDNHRRANEKALAATKKACEESIPST